MVVGAAGLCPGRAALCIEASLYPSGWLWLSSQLEGAAKEELKLKFLVEKGYLPLPSGELNSILFLLRFEC